MDLNGSGSNLDESGSDLDESGLAGAHPHKETYTMFPWIEGLESLVCFEGSVGTRVQKGLFVLRVSVLVPLVSFAPVSLFRLLRLFHCFVV